MKKRLLAWVLTVLLLLSVCPFVVSASEAARVTVQDGTATQGGTVSIYLRADDFADVSVLDIEVYYDTAAMSVDSVSNSSFLSNSSVSTNTAVAGVIKISAMSVKGFSGSGQMMTIRFRVKATCPVGTYPITVAVGDAYDSNLNPATVRGVSGTVTVNAAATQSFSLSASRSKTTAQQGDTFTVQVRNSGSRAFAGADFRLEYDREQLRLTTLELDSNLKVEGAVYSVNQNNPGYAVISYASTNAVSSYNLFIATFEVIADVTARADIKIIADDVYDNDLVAYAPYTLTTSVQITEKEMPPDYADLMVGSDSFALGQTGTASVILQGGAAVAAADFTLYYDPSVFAVSAVTADSAAVAAGAWIVINQNFANGQIKFSYVNEKGSFPDNTELVHITLTAISAPEKHFVLSAAGTGVYNIAYEQTTLDYVSATACIFAPTVTPPTCTEQGYTTYACPDCGEYYVVDWTDALGHRYEATVTPPTCTTDGYTTYTCSACMDEYVDDIVAALGHDEVAHEAQAVTCTEIGWYDYVTCTRCDYTTYDEIAALGHDEVFHAAQEPNCTAVGWYDYVTCARCDYTTYVEIPALGHRVPTIGDIWVDSVAIENDSTYPFLLEDGVYSSTNKWDGTSSYFTITALYDCTLYIDYSVSSEQNCDNLIIRKNGTTLVTVSGLVDWASHSIELKAGDVVTINYRKDSSVATYEDTGWFRFTCEQTLVQGVVYIPAEDAEPTCTDAVICAFCQELIKEALGHDEVAHEGQAVTCTEIGWYDYVTCTRCDYTTYVEISALGHDEVFHGAQEPNCTEVGWYDYVTCTRCDYTTYVEIPALGHRVPIIADVWVDSIVVENDSTYPFLLEDGIYSSTNKTDNTDSYFTITALYDCTLYIDYSVSSEQNYDKLIIRRNGVIIVEISDLVDWTSLSMDLLSGDVVTVNYHKDVSVARNEDTGWFRFTCAQTLAPGVVYVPAEDAEPTCTDAVICAFCQELIKEALGHDEVAHEGQAVTCTEIGWYDYVTCTRCDYTTYVEIPALGHDEVFHEAQAVTCTEIGWYDYVTCTRCDYTTYVEIPALGHDEVFHGAQAPTCTTVGWYDHVTCTRCDYTTYVEIPALGHDEVAHAAQAPTCTEIGWYDYVTCTRCDYTTYVEISALGHDEVFHAAQAVTCTEIGWHDYVTCTRCDYTTYDEIAALGHDEVFHAAQAPTCTTVGWDDYVTCTRCDYTTYVEIPALGHDEVAHAAQVPTCTEIGWHDYVTCTRCDYTTYVAIAATGHHYMDKICTVCGEDQLATNSWDVSADGDGSVMAYGYAQADSTYLLEIVGNGLTKNYSSSPFSSLSGKIGDVRVGDGVTTIGNSFFRNIRIRGTIQLPDSILSIGNNAFYGFSGPKTIHLPASVESIGDFAFYDAKNLIVILDGAKLPSSVGSIWDYNCGHYIQPQQIITTEEATYIIDRNGKAWLAKCYVNVPEFVAETSVNGVTVTGIGAFAFDQRNNMILYTVPAAITSIGTYAFRNCNRLTVLFESEKFPAGFGNNSTDGPPGYCAPQQVIWREDGVYVLDKNGRMCLSRYLGSDKNVTVASEVDGIPVQYIGKYAFMQTYNVTTVTLPNGIDTIGAYAFIHSGVTQVVLPDSLTTIETWGFFGADLTSIVIPENVTTIADSTFAYCEQLKVVYVKSPTIAKNIRNTSTCGDLCRYAQTVVIPADVGNEWLLAMYAYQESAYAMNRECIIYSNCSHDWVQTDTVECIPCQSDGIIRYVCKDCKVEKTQIIPCHDEVDHEAQAPTCTEIGWHDYVTCTRCDYTTYVEIPALGHSYDSVVTAPDCVNGGYTTYTCTVCGDTYVADYTAALGHTAGAEADCTNAQVCIVCGVALNAALGHDEVFHAAQAPTCTAVGWYDYVTCSRCDYTTYVEIPALGHDEVFHGAQEPNCTAVGWYDYVTCTRCDYTTYVEIPALGHDEVFHAAQAPTCTEIGWYDYVTCTRCDYTTYVEIPALGHSYESVATAPTCTEQGYTTYTCTACGDTYVADYTAALGHTASAEADCTNAQVCTVCGVVLNAALGHSYDSVVTAPDCVNGGYTTYTCTACGDSYVADHTAALGHTAGADADCTNAQVCIVCGVELNAALGHDEVAHAAQAPTCTEIGWHDYVTCTRCDYTTYVEIPALGHSYEFVATAPTCTEQGYTTYTCTACGDTYVADYTAALGHTAGAEADCTNAQVCIVCGVALNAALGHDEVAHAAQAPTCTEIGWHDYVTCTRCDYTTYDEIAALGHDITGVEAVDPTCADNGNVAYWYCVECGVYYLDADCTIVTNQMAVILLATGAHTYDHAYDADCNTCGAVRATEQPIAFGGNSVSEDVSGLAFRFAVTVDGMAMDGSTAIYDNATVGGYKLLAMGAIVTNGVETIDIPAVYLCGLTEDVASFAVRIVNIPANQYDTVLTATSYFVLEMDGVATIIYGEAQTCSYNAALN